MENGSKNKFSIYYVNQINFIKCTHVFKISDYIFAWPGESNVGHRSFFGNRCWTRYGFLFWKKPSCFIYWLDILKEPAYVTLLKVSLHIYGEDNGKCKFFLCFPTYLYKTDSTKIYFYLSKCENYWAVLGCLISFDTHLKKKVSVLVLFIWFQDLKEDTRINTCFIQG